MGSFYDLFGLKVDKGHILIHPLSKPVLLTSVDVCLDIYHIFSHSYMFVMYIFDARWWEVGMRNEAQSKRGCYSPSLLHRH